MRAKAHGNPLLIALFYSDIEAKSSLRVLRKKRMKILREEV